MARRATPVTKGRTSPKKPPAATQPARGAKSKPNEKPPTEMPEEIHEAQPMLAGVDEPAHESEAPEPVKARRGRKPKSDGMAATLGSAEDAAPSEAAATEAAPSMEPELELSEPEAPKAKRPEAPPSPRKTRRNREPEASAPPPLEIADEPSVEAHVAAAEWHSESGTVTFDWPAIEHVAATEGANQPMAKLLLAARAEGAKSRWPF